MTKPFKLSQKGLALIKKFEGLRLTAYTDAVGVPTIGYGHTKTVRKTDVLTKKTITEQEADALLKRDVKEFEGGVNRLTIELGIPITQCQFDALVSFAFNVGLGNLKKSTLLKKLYVMSQKDQTSIYAVADEFLRWNRAGGRVLNGLTRRRGEERLLFLGI